MRICFELLTDYSLKDMAGREEDERRYPRNLQGVMQFALNHSDDPTNSSSSAFQEMSKEVHASRFKVQSHRSPLRSRSEKQFSLLATLHLVAN